MQKSKIRMVYLVILLIISIPLYSIGQGIHFEKGLTWQQILDKAKQDNKYIFMDCYTTWCGPCKTMAKYVFTDKDAAEFFNKKFINVSVQMDKTAKDASEIKNWYVDADEINKTYGISAYPTFLYFDPNGKIVHRVTGAYDVKEFISKSAAALDSTKQYYQRFSLNADNEKDSVFLISQIKKALDNSDLVTAAKFTNYYFNVVNSPFANDNLKIFLKTITSSGDNSFPFLLNNADSINRILGGRTDVQYKLNWIFIKEEIEPLIKKGLGMSWNKLAALLKLKYPKASNRTFDLMFGSFNSLVFRAEIKEKLVLFLERRIEPNWNLLLKDALLKYPGATLEKQMAEEKPQFYASQSNWPMVGKAVVGLMEKYNSKMTTNQINNLLWDYLFMHCSNVKMLEKSVLWAQQIVTKEPTEAIFLDTYASLLYKLGKKKEAMDLENKALILAEQRRENAPGEYTDIMNNYQKMKNGERTWKD